jgi:geranyl-CoA carboxylase alpha subunit
MTRFQSLLIANRGEIAVRITRTARRMGLRVVAVYSDADTDAPHVRLADQAVRIGGPAARDSYLDMAAILDAARSSGAQAVHPGYGFLAENADFAQAVLDAGLVWVGPPPTAVRAMGDKARARQLMQVAAVPCIPGYDGDDQSDASLRTQAARIGYPLMVKATAGGGGRGMRLVLSDEGLDAALASARSEAQAAFGVSTLLLERAIHQPRHVEIQVFADAHGHVVHLGERDCSVQRRHQKLIEEAPSPALAGTDGQRLRRRMGDMAVAATRAIAYQGAGTIECLLDPQGHFYFMEMNTRLQVEHPVTEALTGYDLVEWQLRVAQGEPLPETSQDAILARFERGGHAIEVRLCAEDPAQGFLPQSGRLLDWRPADTVRVDHALESGIDIAPFYDSMVAKFMAHRADRATACTALGDALATTVALGVRTNQVFLAACLGHPEFVAGGATTAFIPAHGEELLSRMPPVRATLAAMVVYAAGSQRLGHNPCRVALPLAWPVPLRFSRDGLAVDARLLALGGNRYRVSVGDASEDLTLAGCDAQGLTVTSAVGRETLYFAQSGKALFVQQRGRQTVVEDRTLAGASARSTAAAGMIRAPMAGRIVAVHVRVGQQVAKGEPLAVLEAMKMEHPACAPVVATVKSVCVATGAQVAAGTLLVELEATPASP